MLSFADQTFECVDIPTVYVDNNDDLKDAYDENGERRYIPIDEVQHVHATLQGGTAEIVQKVVNLASPILPPPGILRGGLSCFKGPTGRHRKC